MQNEKFIPPFIKFIEENFSMDDHLFVLLGGLTQKDHPVPARENVIILDPALGALSKVWQLSKIINKYSLRAKSIFVHSLFTPNIVNYFFINQKFLRKSNWIIWGGDLYNYRIGATPKNFAGRLYDFRKKMIIKNFAGIICYNKTEYDYAAEWYGAQGKFYQSFFYLSNLFEDLQIKEKKSSTIFIQVGNSAVSLNNHLEVLDKLEKFKNEDIKIIAPLSYGNHRYREEVIKVGKEKFASKFEALTEFMSFNDYLQLLGDIDIAMFNHKRPQAMGNITSLLGFGKKVYMRSEIASWKLFEEVGVKVYDINEVELTPLDEKVKAENINKVKNYFSKENLLIQWSSIFDDTLRHERSKS